MTSRRVNMGFRCAVSAGALALAMTSVAARAQSAPAEGDSTSGGLEEIIVTARKQSESHQRNAIVPK